MTEATAQGGRWTPRTPTTEMMSAVYDEPLAAEFWPAMWDAAPAVLAPSEDAVERACLAAVAKCNEIVNREGVGAVKDWADATDEERGFMREVIRAALSASAPPAAPADELVTALKAAENVINQLMLFVVDEGRMAGDENNDDEWFAEHGERALTLIREALARHRADCCKRTLERAAEVADRGHCTASGCDPQTTGHSNLCPVGIAAAIRNLSATKEPSHDRMD